MQVCENILSPCTRFHVGYSSSTNFLRNKYHVPLQWIYTWGNNWHTKSWTSGGWHHVWQWKNVLQSEMCRYLQSWISSVSHWIQWGSLLRDWGKNDYNTNKLTYIGEKWVDGRLELTILVLYSCRCVATRASAHALLVTQAQHVKVCVIVCKSQYIFVSCHLVTVNINCCQNTHVLS